MASQFYNQESHDGTWEISCDKKEGKGFLYHFDKDSDEPTHKIEITHDDLKDLKKFLDTVNLVNLKRFHKPY
jgi:hypothetical protein